jgi:Putative Actinobacterial Holin-X, holin superfamily III
MPRETLKGESIQDSLFKLSRDGRSWISAEAALARAEIASDGKRMLVIMVLTAIVTGSTLAAVLLASAGVVVFLAPHVGGLANAAGIVALICMLLAAGCSWWILHLTQSRLGIAAVLKRWGRMARENSGSDG